LSANANKTIERREPFLRGRRHLVKYKTLESLVTVFSILLLPVLKVFLIEKIDRRVTRDAKEL
jgi:hypothetical protein